MKNNPWFYQKKKIQSTGPGVSLDVIGLASRSLLRLIGSAPRAGPIGWTHGLGGSLLKLLENGLGTQVIVFRLLYCLSLPRTSEDRLTSLLS